LANRNAAGLPVITASPPFVEDALTRLGFNRGPEAIGLESVATLIATGHYVGLLPSHYARMLSPRLPLEEVAETPTYRVTFSAVTNPLRPLSRAAQKLLELLELETRVANPVADEPRILSTARQLDSVAVHH
jgi:DNA-binding transcriptional LysR family regulator